MRFKSALPGLGLAAICAVAFAVPVRAHHSHGAYEETFMDIQGVVKEVHLVVPARCHHLKDGSNGCLLGFLKAKDGTVKDWDGNNAPAPADF
jgi:hypothetical protein